MKSLALAPLLLLSGAVSAATVNVVSLKVTDFDFEMTVNPIAGHSGDTSSSEVVNPAGDLAAGAVDPVLSFVLADIAFAGTGSESWSVAARTTAVSPATIDTTTNLITIDLSTWTTAWTQTAVTPPRAFRGCGGVFPDCDAVDQSPLGGTVTGTWNPATNGFEVSWVRDIEVHPFPEGVGNWTLRGTAIVPLPGALLLTLSALGGLGLLGRRPIAA